MGYQRVYWIVIDGVGVGNAPDADAFGDAGSDTLRHVLEDTAVELPVLAQLGLGNLYPEGLPGLARTGRPQAHYARLTEIGPGKDTTSGHWELTGIIRDHKPPTFPDGFPVEFLEQFSARIGRGVIGNRPASGTVIIQELGPQHLETGEIIVYTSADSVFQIAAHVGVVPLDELYRDCGIARSMLKGELGVDRVIARPFTGSVLTGFLRTPDRRDYSLPPPGPTVLDEVKSAGFDVIGVGKISDIFTGQGLTASYPVHGNQDLMNEVSRLAADAAWRGLVFCNLVDFDMLFGHRNNPAGYASALAEFDSWLGSFVGGLTADELLVVVADHGNDPTTPSTDHSREQVPLLLTGPRIRDAGGRELLPAPGFIHAGATVRAALGVRGTLPGTNLLAHPQEEM